MTDELPVHISREELHALEVPTSFEVTGPFDVRLINHGKSLHIHLHLDDALSQIASIDAGNHHVEGDSERRVRIDVDTGPLDDEELLGKLKVASAYGAETRWIDIRVSEPEPASSHVQVDESLAHPQPTTTSTEPTLRPDRPEILVLALGGIALLVAALTALIIQDTRILIGSLLVLGGVLASLFFLLGEE